MITWKIREYETVYKGRHWETIIQKSPPLNSFVLNKLSWSTAVTYARDISVKVKAMIKIKGRYGIIDEDHTEEFHMNSPPIQLENAKSGCFVEPEEGFAVETTFNITCLGWQDEDIPLTYEFVYNTSVGAVINAPITGIGVNRLSTTLPVGDRLQDFEFPVDVHVKDSYGDFTVKRVTVKV